LLVTKKRSVKKLQKLKNNLKAKVLLKRLSKMSLIETDNVYLFIPNIIGKWRRIFSWKIAYYNFLIFLKYVNKPGYARIVLAVISFYFMPTNYVISSWCYIISVLLDALDGHAARKFNQCKKFLLSTLIRVHLVKKSIRLLPCYVTRKLI
jgi:hypothetical protein